MTSIHAQPMADTLADTARAGCQRVCALIKQILFISASPIDASILNLLARVQHIKKNFVPALNAITLFFSGLKNFRKNFQNCETPITGLSMGAFEYVAVPTASASPSGGLLGTNETILVTFSESMQTDTLDITFTGSLSAVKTMTWSNNNKTLTIAPTSVWTAGAGTLSINKDNTKSLGGEVMGANVSGNYTVQD